MYHPTLTNNFTVLVRLIVPAPQLAPSNTIEMMDSIALCFIWFWTRIGEIKTQLVFPMTPHFLLNYLTPLVFLSFLSR